MTTSSSSVGPRFAVSIINYKTADMTIDCVKSVLADAQGHDVQVVVVDNKSADGSVEKLGAWIAQDGVADRVKLVISDTNSGFSGGHNQGLTAAEADYYLVFNSDAVLHAGFFDAMTKAIAANPEAGLFSPRLQWDDGNVQVSQFRFHSPLGELIRSANTAQVTKLFNHRDVPLEPPANVSDIEWVTFACVLLNKKMIDDIGLMDDGYFLYFEDSEYCLRARRKGWKIALASDAVAVHYKGGSGPVKEQQAAMKRVPKYYYEARSRFLYQGFGTVGLIGANLYWHLGRGIAHARRLVGKPVPPVNEAEYKDIWINAFKPMSISHPERT